MVADRYGRGCGSQFGILSDHHFEREVDVDVSAQVWLGCWGVFFWG